jgi:hypothetical protein
VRRFAIFIVLAASLFAGGVRQAHADMVTLSATFVASGFRSGAPVDPVMGAYSITFDNRSEISEQTTGITLSNLNFSIDSPPGFFYNPEFDLLIIGSSLHTVLTVHRSTNDFFLTVSRASTRHPIGVHLVYAQEGSDIFEGSASITPVPEPTTLGLVLVGGIVAGLRLRLRKSDISAT